MSIDNGIEHGVSVRRAESLKVGGCNTCTRESHFVYVVIGIGRTVEFRMCEACAADFASAVSPSKVGKALRMKP